MKYFYKIHGLLYIVYQKVDIGMGIVNVEDSRWDDESKASKHTELLNLL